MPNTTNSPKSVHVRHIIATLEVAGLAPNYAPVKEAFQSVFRLIAKAVPTFISGTNRL